MGKTTAPPGLDDERLMTAAEVAEYLGIPIQSWYRWRVEGKGPRAIRVGKHLRVRRLDLAEWLESQADERPPTA